MEKAETKELLIEKGFSSSQADQLVEIYASNPTYWVQFMMDYELELPNPEGENPFFTGIATFLSFLTFGFIPLIPFIFVDNISQSFIASCGFTAFALVLLGLLRWRITKESIFRSVGEILSIGGISASIAYVVGIFFRA
jgi:vacuolar iron transporter family protein